MKRLIHIFFVALAVTLPCSCGMDWGSMEGNPYSSGLSVLKVTMALPEDITGVTLSGIRVDVENVVNGAKYSYVTDEEGSISAEVMNGTYRAGAKAAFLDDLFNGSLEGIKIEGRGRSVVMDMKKVRTGELVFKEIYCGGCKKDPFEGDYQSDKYVIIHNNTENVQYLDDLCFGCISPYNSTSSNKWGPPLPDFAPVIQAVWQFGGDGTTFPLQPGEDAVVALFGAIDHTQQYPLSVNLSNPEYFVCYNEVNFPNPTYHPAPVGIPLDHYLKLAIKTGKANAYTLSVSSPAVVIFKAKDMTLEEFLAKDDVLIYEPGSTSDQVVCVPIDWIIDAVEVFDGRSSSGLKRLQTDLDASFVYQSAPFLGHTLMRRVNEPKSASLGFEVLVDTNDSSNDFYESEKQSLHE